MPESSAPQQASVPMRPRALSTRDALNVLEQALADYRSCRNAENVAAQVLKKAQERTLKAKGNVDALRRALDSAIEETVR